MNALHDYLSEDQLTRLRAAYDREEMLAAMGTPMPTLVPHSREYIDAIEHAFYPRGRRDDAASIEPFSLSIRERELCLLVLLATHQAQYNLAVHIYLGLMESISTQDISNLLLLAGIYSGVPALATGVRTAALTLRTLEKATTANVREPADNPLNPVSILAILKVAFPYV
jgi:alkylhydroperoxidase/carboxymuconolactone decarboxylase family protein YurZ